MTKKNKKEVLAEIESKQNELDARHKLELLSVSSGGDSGKAENEADAPAEATRVAPGPDDIPDRQDDATEDAAATSSDNGPKKKKNKAKLRLERRQQELAELQEQARKESEGTVSKRDLENEAIARIITPLKLQVHEIRADGHWCIG